MMHDSLIDSKGTSVHKTEKGGPYPKRDIVILQFSFGFYCKLDKDGQKNFAGFCITKFSSTFFIVDSIVLS